MKNFQFKSNKIRMTNQYVVKYRPNDAKKPRPDIDALWRALDTYSSAIVSKKKVAPVEAAFRELSSAVLVAKNRYPDLGIAVVENGREMFDPH